MKNNTKFVFASIAILGMLAFSSAALADNASGSMMMGESMSSTMMGEGSGSMMAMHQTIKPPMLQIGATGQLLAHGMIVQSVASTSFTATVWGVTYTVVPVSGLELFVQTGNSMASDIQFQAGDEVGVSGTVTAESPFTIQARVIRDYSLLTPRMGANEFMNGGSSMMGEGSMMQGSMNGTMTTGTMMMPEGGNGQSLQGQIQQLMNEVQMLQGQINQTTTSQGMMH